MAAFFPMFVNIEHKSFYVYGGGQIAARRIRGLLRFGADVTVVAPQIHEEISQMLCVHKKQLRIEQRSYCLGEIQEENTDYVLAATDDADVNRSICRECRHKEIPVNNASDKRQCDFYFPALIEQDNLVIGVTSTDGDHKRVAGFSRMLRQGIKEESAAQSAQSMIHQTNPACQTQNRPGGRYTHER